MTNRKMLHWVIPPDADAEFVASMEEVLDTYEEPYDADVPVVCLVKRIEFRYAPKHGSWLNAAENELSSLTTQCVARRRFPNISKLKEETKAWSQRSNDKQKSVDWQFQIKDAKAKLKSLHPKVKT